MTEKSDNSAVKWMAGVIAATVATVIGGVATFLFVKEGGPLNQPEPASLGGVIEHVQLDRITPCCTFSVKVSTEGYKGETFTLKASVLNVDTGTQGTPDEVANYIPEAEEDEGASTFRIPINQRGTFVVRFILEAPNGTEVDRKDSLRIPMR
jgi:hypothetical protein